MASDYARVERAIRFLRHHLGRQPRLDEVATEIGLSPCHFQRLFRQWAGISPKRYLEFLTVEQAKPLLRQSYSVLETSYALGLTSPSRLHEQFVAIEASSPGEFKRRWQDVEIRYGVHAGPFGDMLVAQTERGVCFLSFVNHRTKDSELVRLQQLYAQARLISDAAATAALVRRMFAATAGSDTPVHLTLRGTNFQVSVWRALLRIPVGEVVSYRQLAEQLGHPRGARPVAGAVAANPVNFLIPCHRVLRSDGSIGGYRGGAELKQRLLDWEQRK